VIVEKVTADDWTFNVKLSYNKGPLDLLPDDVYASVVRGDLGKTQVLIPPTAQLDLGTQQIDHTAFVIQFSNALTASVTHYGDAYLVVTLVTGGRRLTWDRMPILINKGIE
jgi:hypothetical protein